MPRVRRRGQERRGSFTASQELEAIVMGADAPTKEDCRTCEIRRTCQYRCYRFETRADLLARLESVQHER